MIQLSVTQFCVLIIMSAIGFIGLVVLFYTLIRKLPRRRNYTLDNIERQLEEINESLYKVSNKRKR